MKKVILFFLCWAIVFSPFSILAEENSVWGEQIFGNSPVFPLHGSCSVAVFIPEESDISVAQIVERYRKKIEDGVVYGKTGRKVEAIFVKPIYSFTDWAVVRPKILVSIIIRDK